MPAERVVLITGSTDGVGRLLAQRLAAPGTHVLIHGRDSARGDAVVAATERAGGTATFVGADLASLSEVRHLADAVTSEHDHVDILVNNAGMSIPDGPRRESPDGFERHFAVNYLAPFLLTRLLLPSLGARRSSRVVNVISAGQSAVDLDDPMLERGYDGYRAYGQSKVALAMLTFDLAEQYDATRLTANCLHPGTHLDTTMVRAAGIRPAGTADQGADAVLTLATSDALAATTGRYFDGKRKSRVHPQAYDPAARARLRSISERLTALTPQ
ncbi:NAD(P)-dependent dehydrogenase (short-subunit alcohol dehydrogenase family) [Haloactinopolyspora alba]|uniref:NAD(P)-dependent dehydrogenase (Short-subunit alcohol dehydrogenase family) n=1 Tax=Haloactinopolyspora alba TaxID=648780 RepID=A0A2P8DX52_9ACTN|nr:SDR family NAD(P)-dependent oxidoreductase [Haloactinopolyspora alba]PSL01794.1 NAD(P)-dependent dehydrogenase (short-subunit alcohol dehydrogenase family) [Haloactinopolyspora alba]